MFYTEIKDKNTSEIIEYFEKYFFEDAVKNEEIKKKLAAFEKESNSFAFQILNDLERFEFFEFSNKVKSRLRSEMGDVTSQEQDNLSIKVILLLIKVMCREDIDVEVFFDSEKQKKSIRGDDFGLFYMLEEFMSQSGIFKLPVDKNYLFTFTTFENSVDNIMNLAYNGGVFNIELTDDFLKG